MIVVAEILGSLKNKRGRMLNYVPLCVFKHAAFKALGMALKTPNSVPSDHLARCGGGKIAKSLGDVHSET